MISATPVDAARAADAERKIAGVSIASGTLHRAGLNSVVTRSERKFDADKLPPDMLRVYRKLEEKYTEEYALLFVFTMRTAIEMHRAWHSEYKMLHNLWQKACMRAIACSHLNVYCNTTNFSFIACPTTPIHIESFSYPIQ